MCTSSCTTRKAATHGGWGGIAKACRKQALETSFGLHAFTKGCLLFMINLSSSLRLPPLPPCLLSLT